MAGYSKTQLIDWMREQPRTLGWGAVLAFNRTDTNSVLLQDYIERFSATSYLAPVQGYVDDVSADPHYISGYVLDCPRLSFDIADVEQETPDARLTMKVVGGTHVTFKKTGGSLHARRIDVADPLNGPALTLNLQLVEVPGTITSAGQVVMDLSRSSDFSLSYCDDPHAQQLGGMHFQALFERLPDDQRIMVLSEITRNVLSPVKPERLKLRTQAAPGARVRQADNYGDGAVLVFVAMAGEPDGSLPGQDYRYLIPNDAEYGATVLLSNKLLLDTIIANRLKRAAGVSERSLTTDTAGFFRFLPANGKFDEKLVEYVYQGHDVYVCMPDFSLKDSTRHTHSMFWVTNNAIRMTADRATGWPNSNISIVQPDNNVVTAYLSVNWSIEAYCNYVLDKATQQLNPDFPVPPSLIWHYDWSTTHASHPLAVAAFKARESEFLKNCDDFYNGVCADLLNGFPAINVFVLQSLLFRHNHSMVLDDVALPGDMAIFGRIGPSINRFTVTPLQPVIGLGESLQFAAQPAGQAGLSWKVENILGSVENPGTISSSGLYKAPDRIAGAFIRVKVTASAGNASSSALVSVVVNDISVGPQIQICEAGFPCTLSAGTRGSGTLRWSLRTPANGGDLNPDSGSSKYVYTAPEKADGKTIIVDEIVVTNELTGKSKSARVAVIFGSSLVIVQDRSVSLPAGQARLRVFREGQEVDATLLTWEVLAGSGTVTEGVFTQPVELEDRFALVHACVAYPGFGTLNGYSLLPLPLLDNPVDSTLGFNFMAV